MIGKRQLRRQLVAAFAVPLLLMTAACQNRTASGDKLPPKSEITRPRTQIVGRVHAVDAAGGNVIVMLNALEVLPPGAGTRQLVARNPDDLKPSATLSSVQNARGKMLGTRLISGLPKPGDEVILLPEQ